MAWCVVAIIASAVFYYYISQVVKPKYDACVYEAKKIELEDNKGGVGAATSCSEWTGFFVDIGSSVSIQFISASIVALFFLGLLALVKEDEEAVLDVEILYQPEQKKRHFESLRSTTFWYHDGHLASWVRRKVLPHFTKECENHMTSRQIKAAILDPTDNQVCESYISHIKGLPQDEQRFSDMESLQAELCATIYVFSRSIKPTHLCIELFLKSSIDYIRDDINSTCAFWTTVGSNPPAIAFKNRNNRFLYYNLIYKNFDVSIQGYTKVNLVLAAQQYQAVHNGSECERIASVMASVFPSHTAFQDEDFIKKVEKQIT